MRALSSALLLVLGLASSNALADATVKIVVNAVPVISMTSSTGMQFSIDNQQPFLSPGQSVDFRYDWSVTVHDDGLPVVYNGPTNGLLPPTGCTPLLVSVCGPQPSGFEQAVAALQFGYTDLRHVQIPPGAIDISVTGDSFIQLATNADAKADSLTRSGVTTVHVSNAPNSFFSGNFPFSVWSAGWTYASPIPEPSSWALLAAALAVLAPTALRLRKRAEELRLN